MGGRRRLCLVAAAVVSTPALAGCLGAFPSTPLAEECEAVQIPSPRGGASFRYNASGRGILRPTIDAYEADWGAVTGTSQHEIPLRFRGNTSLEVHVAEEPRPHRWASGEVAPAHQVTLTAYSSNRSAHLPFLDVWLDPATGNAVDLLDRNGKYDPERGVRHIRNFGGWGRPPLLLASLFWDGGLEDGASGTLPLPEVAFAPEPDKEVGSVSWDVRTSPGGQGCRATVRARVEPPEPDGVGQTMTATFTQGTPLPVRYRADFPPSDVRDLRLRLRSWDGGDGPRLPSFEAAEKPETTFPLKPLEDGFLPRSKEIFPTSYDEALRALREGERTGRWLRENPRARPQLVEHAPGDPESRVVDGWTMRWVTPDREARWLYVTKREPVVPLMNGTETETRMSTAGNIPPYPEANRTAIPLGSLAKLHQEAYGIPLRALECTFAWQGHPDVGACELGPVNATAFGYHREPTAGIHWGFTVWLERGRVLSEASWTQAPVPSPAGPSAG